MQAAQHQPGSSEGGLSSGIWRVASGCTGDARAGRVPRAQFRSQNGPVNELPVRLVIREQERPEPQT
jgi:hypothetical protein